MHPTRRTRIHSKGRLSPLEGLQPHRDTGANKGSICRYNMLDSLLKVSPLRARERPSTECVEGAFSEVELRVDGILRSSHSSGPTPSGIRMYKTGRCRYP